MPPPTANSLSLPERLQSFEGYWDEDEAAARQLAVIGHVYDRPPLASLEEGTYCISCGAFVKRTDSVATLQASMFKWSSKQDRGAKAFTFHEPKCTRYQLRIPLRIHTAPGQLGSLLQSGWRRPNPDQTLDDSTDLNRSIAQSHPLFTLPAEIQTQVYSLIVPRMKSVTTIVSIDAEGTRLTSWESFENLGHYDPSRLNLLRTCRAIHGVALDVLFHATTYTFDSSRLLYLFLRHIGTHGRQLLQAIDVVCGSREDAIAFALLASCPKLKSVTIRLARGKLLPGNRSSLWILDGVASLLELSGLRKVTLGECGVSPYLRDDTHDGELLRRELTRPKGAPSGVRWVDGCPDI